MAQRVASTPRLAPSLDSSEVSGRAIGMRGEYQTGMDSSKHVSGGEKSGAEFVKEGSGRSLETDVSCHCARTGPDVVATVPGGPGLVPRSPAACARDGRYYIGGRGLSRFGSNRTLCSA